MTVPKLAFVFTIIVTIGTAITTAAVQEPATGHFEVLTLFPHDHDAPNAPSIHSVHITHRSGPRASVSAGLDHPSKSPKTPTVQVHLLPRVKPAKTRNLNGRHSQLVNRKYFAAENGGKSSLGAHPGNPKQTKKHPHHLLQFKHGQKASLGTHRPRSKPGKLHHRVLPRKRFHRLPNFPRTFHPGHHSVAGTVYCRVETVLRCVDAPAAYKRTVPYCPIKMCYKYKVAPKCPRSSISSTHKCSLSSKKRTAWTCRKGHEPRKVFLKGSTEPMFACPCFGTKRTGPVMSPMEEFHPKCNKK